MWKCENGEMTEMGEKLGCEIGVELAGYIWLMCPGKA